jgi:superfamily II DNA/RNA helicase
MPFKKLHPGIQKKLTSLEITEATAFQTKSIPVIKSGANVFCIAPKDSGKTTTLILSTLQKLKYEAAGNAPRAVIIVENTKRVLELHEAFLLFTKRSSIRVYAGHDDLHIDMQKSEIFEGVDILISTPKMLNKLFLANGVHTSQIKIFSIDDAEFLSLESAYTAMMSLTQSIQKCQYVIYTEKIHPKLKRFESYFMEYPKTVTG